MSVVRENLPLIAAGAVLLLSIALGFWARRRLWVRLARLAEKTSVTADLALVDSLKQPLPIWLLLGGVFLATRIVRMPRALAPSVDQVLLSVLIVSITLWAANLVARLIQLWGLSEEASFATGVVRHVARIFVLLLGGLVLLGNLGISLAPVFTTVGLGGLAVALGLQKTLSNLFAGMEISLAKSIRVGDWVKLESGEEGCVEDIHWRTTRVHTQFNNSVFIPNSRLAESVVINYHLPSKNFVLLVQVGVHSASDLEQVERVTLGVARSIMQTIAGGVSDFEPFVRYHTFGESSIEFNVALRAQEFADQFLIKHEFIKAITRAFAKEGIVIPYPIRVVKLQQEPGLPLRPAPSPSGARTPRG